MNNKFARQARLPWGAYTPDFGKVLGKYGFKPEDISEKVKTACCPRCDEAGEFRRVERIGPRYYSVYRCRNHFREYFFRVRLNP